MKNIIYPACAKSISLYNVVLEQDYVLSEFIETEKTRGSFIEEEDKEKDWVVVTTKQR